ncbi:MAG: rod shape-determining protein MreD [Candidatus Marinimicrobia bacterium]|nr:rod shape-determining protein MreD [Candidatus Neomarinimicrobiota bacterium]
MGTRTENFRLSYIVLSLLFVLSIILNNFIGIAGIHPDILLILLFYLAAREKPYIVLFAAFAFGFLQDIFLPGNIQYWGLSPLFKTLLAYALLKLRPFILRLKGFTHFAVVFGMMFLYFVFYDLLYYSGYIRLVAVLYRYAFPETAYTFLLFTAFQRIFPLGKKDKGL